MLLMGQFMAQMKMLSEENNRKMEVMSRKMDENSTKIDVMGDEIKREMSEAMGREMAVVREEVRECRIGVREEVRESEARLMGEIGNITKEVGLTIGQNELKEQMEKNTGAIKELRATEKETTRGMTEVKNECKIAHEKLTKRVEEVTQTMGTKEREMETQIETTKVM